MTRSRTVHLMALVLLWLSATLSSSCADADRTSDSATVRDSAGIQIVESASAMWEVGQEWRLSPEPTLTIGVIDGAEEYQLFRAASAVRLATGEIVVANSGTYELRFYDSSGGFLRKVGREGEGPGEYRLLRAVWRHGTDSLIVPDPLNRRVNVLTGDGEFVRSFSLGADLVVPLGLLSEGTFLCMMRERPAEGERPEGLVRSHMYYARYDVDGGLLDTLVRRPGDEGYYGGTENMSFSLAPPFGRRTQVTAGGDRWYYGSSDVWEIERYSADGTLTQLIRRREPNRPITAEIAEDYKRGVRESLSEVPEPIRRAREDLSLPETMPAYKQFIVDDEDNLWVAEYTRSEEQPSWAVFDPDGRFLGTVSVPADGVVTHIGPGFVLGIWTGEMDEDQVREYELIKP